MRSAIAVAVFLVPCVAEASDLARTLGFIQAAMGDEAIAGLEEFLDDDPTEALPILLAKRIDPGEAPNVYVRASLHDALPPTGLEVYADPDPQAIIIPGVEHLNEPAPAEAEAPVVHDRGRAVPVPHFETLGGQRLSYSELSPFIAEAAQLTGLPEALIDAVIRTESGYRPKAVSRVGAMGLMQLMPQTAASVGVTNAFDPRQNILGGAQYLRKMYDQFGSVQLAVAAYNAGPGAVAKHDGVPPFTETRRYVKTVMRRYARSNLR